MPDPNGEDFCGYGTRLTCRARAGSSGLTTLPTLGGNARRRAISTTAAKSQARPRRKSSTRPVRRVIRSRSSTTSRHLGAGPERTRQLPLLRGDTVGVAARINDKGRPSGSLVRAATARCFRCRAGRAPCYGQGRGMPRSRQPGRGHDGCRYRHGRRGEVVGRSRWPGQNAVSTGTTPSCGPGGRACRTLARCRGTSTVERPAWTIEARSSVCPGMDPATFTRFTGRKAQCGYLNTLVPADAPVYLLFAAAINADGAIAGWGVHKETGEVHAFQAHSGQGAITRRCRPWEAMAARSGACQCSRAYSAFACARRGISGSASFHTAKKSS